MGQLTLQSQANPGQSPVSDPSQECTSRRVEGAGAFYIVGKYGVYVSDKMCCLSRLFRWLKPSDSNPALLLFQVKRQEVDFHAKR